MIDALQARRGSKVVTFFLRDGVPIAEDSVVYVYEHLRRIGKQPGLDLFLNSRGGQTEVPWSIVPMFREFTDRFCVLLPFHAESAATHISLGADEIVMTEIARLGPVDPTRRHPLLPKDPYVPQNEPDRSLAISVQDLRHFVQFIEKEGQENTDVRPSDATGIYTELMRHVHPLVIGAMEQSYALAKLLTKRLLSLHMDPNTEAAEIDRLTDSFADAFKSHGYPIQRREARDLGLKVTDAGDELRDEMWKLWLYYTNAQIAGTMQGQDPAGKKQTMMFQSAGFMDSEHGSAAAFTLQTTSGAPAGGAWFAWFPV
jgi:Serine dehydrogenase proteinase